MMYFTAGPSKLACPVKELEQELLKGMGTGCLGCTCLAQIVSARLVPEFDDVKNDSLKALQVRL